MVTHGVARVIVLVNPSQAARLSEHSFGPVAFRPMVTHGVAVKEATRLSARHSARTHGFPSHSYLWFGL